MKNSLCALVLGSSLLLAVTGCEQKIVTPAAQPSAEKKTETTNTTVVNPAPKATTTETTTTTETKKP